jgi:hypothetical protein
MPLAAAQVGLSLIDRRPCLYLSQLAQQRGFSLLASGTLVSVFVCGGGDMTTVHTLFVFSHMHTSTE